MTNPKSTGPLVGKRALISGAAGGLGIAIAQKLSEAGAQLILLDHPGAQFDQLLSTLPTGAEYTVSTCDVTDAAAVTSSVSTMLVDASIEILVNGAGILEPIPFLQLDIESWDRTLAVNLRGAFLLCRAVAPSMVQNRWGRIINIASQIGQRGGAERTHYAASKAGLIGFTKSLARELAPHNVLVNAIAPGPLDTPMTASFSPESKAARSAELPLGRFGQADEVAPTALLLASEPDGNLYVGQTLGPNSGDVML